MQTCNAVFEGGGLKGIGHIGAICSFEKHYKFENVVGSSAGAIVAALLCAGYSGEEMHQIMLDVNYQDFLSSSSIPIMDNIKKIYHLLFQYGIYSSDQLERWIQSLLEKKCTTTFRDVKNEDGTYRLRITTVDLSTKKLLILPDDLDLFNIHKDSFPIAKAVQMSIALPIFFKPFKLKDREGKIHYLVDGGLLSNYPIWVLDSGSDCYETPIFGFRFSHDVQQEDEYDKYYPCKNIIDYTKLNISTLLNAADHVHISYSKGDHDRTVFIPSTVYVEGKKIYIPTTDFDIQRKEIEALFQNGKRAGDTFLSKWNFQSWLQKFRPNCSLIK